MSDPAIDQIQIVLSAICYDDSEQPLSSLLADQPKLATCDGQKELTLDFTVPVASQAGNLAAKIKAEFPALTAINVGSSVPQAGAQPSAQGVKGVRNIIAVASGKGGVGKSTTSVNLALALRKEGANVGLLDADIYGPSQAHMLGTEGKRPEATEGNRIVPLRAHGIQCVSMGNLITDTTPMVWRGPMASGALQQLLANTEWHDLDYLIIDMPPGTGDIPLTLSQKVPVTGAVIVTTPQDIALLDAKKGIEMFQKVNIPILGIVENMAVHVCSKCGHEEHIFGEKGGLELAENYGVEQLAALPLDIAIRKETDAGVPSVAADPTSSISALYRSLARKVALGIANLDTQQAPVISISDD